MSLTGTGLPHLDLKARTENLQGSECVRAVCLICISLRNFPCPAWGRGTREWMKIPPRPPLAKGGWGGFESYFLTNQKTKRDRGGKGDAGNTSHPSVPASGTYILSQLFRPFQHQRRIR